jgi:hypothetical protein
MVTVVGLRPATIRVIDHGFRRNKKEIGNRPDKRLDGKYGMLEVLIPFYLLSF